MTWSFNYIKAIFFSTFIVIQILLAITGAAGVVTEDEVRKSFSDVPKIQVP